MLPEGPSPGSEPRDRPTPATPGGIRVPSDAAAPPPIPDHELIRLIARGSYGEVWLARSALGTLRAVKIVRRQTFWHDHPFEREFKGIQRVAAISTAWANCCTRSAPARIGTSSPPCRRTWTRCLHRPTTEETANEICARMTDALIDALAEIEGVRVGPRKSGWIFEPEEILRRRAAQAPYRMEHAICGHLEITNAWISGRVELYETGADRVLWSTNF